MFRTKVVPAKSDCNICLKDRILSLGSCFAQNTGQKLQDYKFDININPFGTLFNPVSIFKLVNRAAHSEIIDALGVVESQGVYHHYDLHSDLSNLNREKLLSNANKVLGGLGTDLPATSYIIYTFGTAVVYELKETGEIVANCHKVPSHKFNRRLLDVEEIVYGFKVNYDLVKSMNRYTRFIVTVSPVRHQKESFEQNNVSKSILRIACDRIVKNHADVEYFPAFEIMMDELRDYRFYAEDMLHPNAVATDYIWQKFSDTYFDDEHKEFILKWEKVRKALAHKPFNSNSKEHQSFIRKTIRMLDEFKRVTDTDPELKLLKAQLL
ncbi:MAG: GSCFA domain-containing protein [Cytophagales bacterium]|nr:GSCFA domain-containing protein [Cytophagales bacterium]